MMEDPRNQTSSVGRRISRLKYDLSQDVPAIAMLWINEIDVAKSADDLLMSQFIEGHEFHDFEMFDAKIASALKRIITYQYFRRRVNVEEQHAQTYGRFLRGLIYGNFWIANTGESILGFRAAGAHEATLDLSELFHVSFVEETTLRISIQDGTKLHSLQCPGEFVQDEDTRIYSASKQETDRAAPIFQKINVVYDLVTSQSIERSVP